jgi:hypothetical protein
VLGRKKFLRRLDQAGVAPRELILGYAALARVVQPLEIEPVVRADPDDDAVLACALAADAELIVSGDSHLLDLRKFRSIRILTAAESWLLCVVELFLRRIGLPVPESVIAGPERRLYDLLAKSDSDSAHSRYNALVRRLVSFENAAECALSAAMRSYSQGLMSQELDELAQELP